MEERLTDDELLRKGVKQVQEWYSWWGQNNTNGQDDRRFLFESQWDARELRENLYLGKAQLQFNKLYDFYRKAIAEQRKNTVSLKLRATENATAVDQETIDLHEGLLRSIAYSSKTEQVYQTAFATQLHTSYGVIVVSTEYENEKSFNQKICIKALENPERAFFDPNAREPNKEDGDFCGYYMTYSKAYFKKLYPNVDPATIQTPTNFTSDFTWGNENQVTVVKRYYKEYFDERIYLLANGETVTRKEYNQARRMIDDARLQGADELILMKLESDLEIEDKRWSKNFNIKWCVQTQTETLEEGEWPIKKFPVIYVDGDSYWDKEKQYTQSFIRHAKDAQRFLNYCAIEIATALKNSRKETFLVTPQNIKGFEKIWKNPEKQQGALPYNFDPQAGPPVKLPANELSQSLLQQYQRAELDVQSIMGVYEAAVGAESNEKSGIAIANRAKQSQNSMFIFFDNLNRAVEQCGRVVVDLMPHIYDTEREVNITDENGQTKAVLVNKYDFATDSFQNQIEDYKWDLEIEVGASFEIQKQEAVQTLVSLTQVSPETFPMVADLIAENLDLINTPQLVERFKNFVPPEILAKERGEPPPPPKPNPQEQMMQMQMQAEQQRIQLEQAKLQAQVQREQDKTAIDHEKNQVESVKNEIDALKAMAELQQIPAQLEMENIRANAEVIKAQTDLEGNMLKAYGDAAKLVGQIHQATAASRENMKE